VEFFSHNKWYAITLLPAIVISYMFYQIPSWNTFNLPLALLTALTGFLFFSITEYCLHRFVFHSEAYLPDSKLVRYLHYIMHGIHHMLPNDPYSFLYLATDWSIHPSLECAPSSWD
jgi:4-hydroxysphinganine ceramide fatty acyl 2-hydroxylase